MENSKSESEIIGTWKSNVLESDMGSVQNTIIFNVDNSFQLESLFGSSENAIVTRGIYEVNDYYLFTKQLNKGKPIPIEFKSEGNELILHIPGEEPTKLFRD